MMSITSAPTMLPRVDTGDQVGSPKLYGERRRSSVLDMSLMTV